MMRRWLLTALTLSLLGPTFFVVLHGLWHFQSEWVWHLVRTVLPGQIKNTIFVAGYAAVVALFLGGIPAFLVRQSRFPAQRFLIALQLMALTLPAHICAGVYQEASSAASFESLPALGLEMGAATAPFVFLFLFVALARIPAEYEEAAAALGAPRAYRFAKILLPLLAPAFLSAVFLVTAEAVSDLGAATRVGISTLSVGLHNLWLGISNDKVATTLVLLLVGICALTAFPFFALVQKITLQSQASKALATPPRPTLKGVKACAAVLACLGAATPGFLLPTALSARWAVEKINHVNLTNLYQDTWSSVVTAVSVVVVCLCVTLLYLYLMEPGQKAGQPERLTWWISLNYLLPALVLAYASFTFTQWLPFSMQFLTPLQDTRAAIVLPAALRFLPFLLLPAADSLRRTPPSLRESAQSLGMTRTKAFFSVLLPLQKPALAAGILLVFVLAMQELTLSLTLQPFDYSSLSLRIFNYANLNLAKEPSVWIFCLQVVCFYPLWRLSGFLAGMGEGDA